MRDHQATDDPFLERHDPPPGTFWATDLEKPPPFVQPRRNSYVDTPVQTYEEQEHAQDLCQSFRHSGWASMRKRIARSFCRTCQDHAVYYRFAECGHHCWVFRDPEVDGRYAVRGSFCRSRWCTPCQLTRGYIIGNNVIELIAGKPSRFLTLTLAHSDAPLGDQIDKLQTDFRRLRQSTWWKRRVSAGVWFLEVKWSKRTQQWHPHLHMLVQGSYLKHSELKQLWYKVTGTSYVVWIEYVRSEEHIARYVSKYTAKGLGVTYDTPDRCIDQLVVTMRGRRLCGAFGDWRHEHLAEPPKDATDWQYVARLDRLLLQASRGNEDARAILDCLNPPTTVEYGDNGDARAPPVPENARLPYLGNMTPDQAIYIR